MGLKINGSTSGSIEIDVPAVAGTNTAITIPATTGGEFIVSDASGNVDLGALDISGSASADSVVIDSSGRVGIATASPQVNVDIAPTTSSAILRVHARTDTSAEPAIELMRGANTTFGADSYGDYRIKGSGGDLRLEKGADGSTVEHIRFDNSFKVTAPAGIDCLYSTTPTAAGTSVTIFRGGHSATAGTPGSGTDSFYVFANGNVQNTNNSYGQISDVKLKENIVDASSQWNDLKAVQVRNFNFKEETGNPTHTQIGVIAQELELVSPGLVKESPDRDEKGNDLGTTTKSVSYSVLYMKAVKALQEAMERIETLETANASQAATIAAFEARLTALEGGAA